MIRGFLRMSLGHQILYLVSLPYTLLVGYPYVLLACALRLAESPQWEHGLVLRATWRPWWAARWRYSTTIGRGIVYHPDHRSLRVHLHERVHVRQIEDLMLLGLVLGAVVAVTGHWILGLVLWTSAGTWQAPNFLTAWLRGGDPYRDSEHERSAYAQTAGRKTA